MPALLFTAATTFGTTAALNACRASGMEDLPFLFLGAFSIAAITAAVYALATSRGPEAARDARTE